MPKPNPYRSAPRFTATSIVVPIPPLDIRAPAAVAVPVGRAPKSLTAASRVLIPPKKGVITHRQSSAVWQQEAWSLSDQVGELRYAANLYGNGLSRIRLELTRLTPIGKTVRLSDLEEDKLTETDKTAREILEDFTSDQTLTEMQRLWGVNKFIVGEALLVGVPDGRGSGRKLLNYSWKMYSRDDVKQENGIVKVCGESYDEQDVLLIQILQPHPRFSHEADSPVRASLPVIRELVGLTMHVSALIDSRLAGAGILLLPTSATVLGATAPEDDQEEDPTVSALIESMVTPIRDRDSAASIVPLVMTAPDESVDAIRHITFASPLEAAAKDLRDEAIRRLALGLDMPPEELLGAGGTSSHWGAWMVQEDNVKMHLIPGVQIFSTAIVAELLRPMLLELGVPEEEANLYSLEPVGDELISRPKKFDEALELYKVDGISLGPLLRSAGFELTDAPAPAEDADRAVDLAIKAVSINPSLFQDPGLPNLISQLRSALAGQDASNAPPEASPTPLWKESEGREAIVEATKPTDGDRPTDAKGPAENRERDNPSP